MDDVGIAVHLDDVGFLPAIAQDAHGVADLKSARSRPTLRSHRSRPRPVAASIRTRLKGRRRWWNLATVRVGLRFGGRLRVAFCRKQSRELCAKRLPSLVCHPLLVVLKFAGAGGLVARKDFEALSVRAHVNNIRLQLRRLRERAGHQNSQSKPLRRESAHLSDLALRMSGGGK